MAVRTPATSRARPKNATPWTFLTNHTHVLYCIVSDPDVRMRDVASAVGVTERAVQKIVADLEVAGYLTRERDGRRNRYQVRAAQPLRHPIEQHCEVASLLAILTGGRRTKKR